MPTHDAVWSARDTTPAAVEAALRAMEAECHAADDGYAPARALNLVCVVDAQWSGEIANRLRQVGRHHASRTVVCSVEPGRTTLDARATTAVESAPAVGELAGIRETVVLSVGERHLPALDTLVDPLVVTDLTTVAWAPHGHDDAIDALTGRDTARLPIAQVVLLDSLDEPDVAAALARAVDVAGRATVVDLAWQRCTPWRERLAGAFDPPRRRADLGTLAKVSVRHRADSQACGLLLLGWLCTQLGWHPEALARHDGLLRGHARRRRGEVELRLEAVEDLSAPGLAGVEVTTDAGAVLGLERGEGGLTARRAEPAGRGSAATERTWTVLGASRGEGGILGEGIRHALLRDPAHAGALTAAARLAA